MPFVMELPNYRMPGAKNVAHLLWEKAKDFLQRAFTVIFVATIVIWVLQTFNIHFNVVESSHNSILAKVAGWIAPIFKPLGFGDWRISTALISGVMAKESVVSTLSVLFGDTKTKVAGWIAPIFKPLGFGDWRISTALISGVMAKESVVSTLSVLFGDTKTLLDMLSTAGAASLLVFCLLYTPCIAAVASVKKELGGKWATVVALGQFLIAWIVAFIIRIIGMIL